MAAPDPDAVARLVHAERMADSLVRERPFLVEPWERRTDEQRDMDRRIAAAVAGAERERIALLAESRKATYPLYEQPGLIVGHPLFADLIRKGASHG